MNCCDDNGKCVCGNGGATPCPHKTPLRLAPGVIDFGHPTWGEYVAQERRRELVRMAKAIGWWLGFCVLAGLAAGLVSGVLP